MGLAGGSLQAAQGIPSAAPILDVGQIRPLTDELPTEGSFRLPVPITTVSRALYWVNPGRNISVEAGVRF